MMGMIDNLPKEIMLDILARLPAESALECKLVCKPWRDHVRLPSFSKMHLNHMNSDSGKLNFIITNYESVRPKFYYSEYQEDFHETPPISRLTKMELNLPFDGYSLAGSDNGLICFNSSDKDSYGPAYICNPITREYVILPGFNGNYWWTGFGYIHSTNEYKIVRIHMSRGDSKVGIVEVYTLGSGKGWRNVGRMGIDMDYVRKGVGAFLNGALHWADKEFTIVFAFCLAEETFSQLQSPPSCLTQDTRPGFHVKLGVLGDFVSATNYLISGGSEIWLLKGNKDNGLSWSKEFSFGSPIQQPVCFTTSGRLLCCEYHSIHSYNQRTSSDKMDVSFGRSINQVILHRNTFVSLKVLGEKDTKTMKSGEKEIPKHRYNVRKRQNKA